MTHFDETLPIYVQVKNKIINMILSGALKPGDKIPSTNEMVQHYKINHVTIAKGITQLVDEGILYKKRGIGMFVSDDAPLQILNERKASFKEEYVLPLLREGKRLKIDKKTIIKMIEECDENE